MLMSHSEMRSESKVERPGRWPWIAVSLVVGLAAVFCVVRAAGFEATRLVVVGALPWLPWVVALEGCRVATEVFAARSLFGLLGAAVPSGAPIRAPLVG